MRTTLALLVALVLMSLARIGWAESASVAPPSAPLSFIDALPPAPPPLPPAPEREPSEFARKSWELLPHVGLTTPSCQAAPYGGSACADVGSGLMIGAGGVYRITPYVALGAELAVAEFRYDAAAAGASRGASRAGQFGPIFRGYFLENGRVDPWVQVGFGMGFVGMNHISGGAEWNARATGAAASGAAGVDFWLTPYLKLGPSIGQQFVFPSEVRVCENGGCASYAVGEAGGITRWMRLGVNVTVALGRSM